MIEWKKIQDKKFLISSSRVRNKFIISSSPFSVYLVKPDLSRAEVLNFSKQINTDVIKGYKSYFAVDIVLTTMCNLRCTYCCALAKNSERFYDMEPMRMTIPTAEKMVDFTLELFEAELRKDPDSKTGSFDVFVTGGEPLLNFKVLQFIVEKYSEKIKILATKYKKQIFLNTEVATNGSLVTEEVEKFFKKYDIQSAITIDGPMHDKRRIFMGGKGSLKAVLAGLNLLIKHKNKIKLQSVVSTDNSDYIRQTLEFYKSLGLLKKIKRIHFIPQAKSIRDRYCRHVRNCEIDIKSQRKFSQTLLKLSKQYHLDIKNYQGRLTRSIQIGGLSYRCPAGQWKIAVAPDGSIFPCHQLTNIKEFYMGNVVDEKKSLKNSVGKIRQIFQKRTVFKVNPCKNCLFQTICIPFVDCPARCFIENRNLYKVDNKYCQIHQPYMESVLEDFLVGIKN